MSVGGVINNDGGSMGPHHLGGKKGLNLIIQIISGRSILQVVAQLFSSWHKTNQQTEPVESGRLK